MLEETLNAAVGNGIHITDESNWAPLLPRILMGSLSQCGAISMGS